LKKRVLTGIQPSGTLHLGNYLGAIRPAIELQRSFDAFYFIADYHALTSVKDPEILRQTSLEIAATLLALGLDTERTALFRQSAVPEVAELAWILSCQVPVGMLERGHAVKAAQDGGRDVSAGTWFYPVLMSADILLYGTNLVPVGKDQKQHVEIARDIALKVNHNYGDDTLVVPDVMISEVVGVVPGTDGRKMSKSYGNILPLWESPEARRKRVMKIVTDSKGVDDVKDPDSDNIFNLYKLFATPEQTAALAARYRAPGMGYGHAKQALFEVLEHELAAPRERYNDWMAHPERIEAALDRGAELARRAAVVTLSRLRSRVGLTGPSRST
jgi:tryptophanyl-tRNA synthetase